MTAKNTLILDENNKTAIKNNLLIKEYQKVNPFRINSDNCMSNSEFMIFRDDILKIKAQLEVMTSNNYCNRSIQNPNNNPWFPPYLNNYCTGLPNSYINHNNINNPFLGRPSTDKVQSTILLGNNLDDSVEENNNNHNQAYTRNNSTDALFNNNNENNINANNYNNSFFSSNNMQHAINFMNQGFPFIVPTSFQTFPYIKSNNQSNIFKDKSQVKGQNAAGNNDTRKLMEEAFDIDTSVSNMDNLCDNNFNQNKNKENNCDAASNRNLDLNIPSSFNTFNMIFVNTKINDVNLGYKKRNYNRKQKDLPSIKEKNSANIEQATAEISEKKPNSQKKIIDKTRKNTKENQGKIKNQKLSDDKKKKNGKTGKGKNPAAKKDKEKKEPTIIDIKSYNNISLERYEETFNMPKKSHDQINGIQENEERVINESRKYDNYSEVSLDSFFN